MCFHLSLKARLLLLITAILMFGMAVGAVFILKHAREAVRAEIQSTLRLVSQLVDTKLSGSSTKTERRNFDPLVQALANLRHVRVIAQDAELDRTEEVPQGVPGVPEWFVRLVAPPRDGPHRIEVPSGGYSGSLVIEANPADEIREVWEDVYALLLLAGAWFPLVGILIYAALGQGLRPLNDLLVAFEHLEKGDFQARVQENAAAELERIHRKFNQMAEVLHVAVERNRLLSGRLVTLQEEERRSLAHELHDDMAPYLFDIKVHLSAIHNLMQGQQWAEVPPQLEAIDAAVGQLQQQVRGMLHRLRPRALDDLGLEQALRDLVETWQSRCRQVEWELEVTGLTDELDDTLQVTVYRIVQECLTNIARHAEASRAQVQVALVPALEPGKRTSSVETAKLIDIRVQDDGKGTVPGAKPGLGLMGIEERVQALGGSMTLFRPNGQGLCVHAWIPVGFKSCAHSASLGR